MDYIGDFLVKVATTYLDMNPDLKDLHLTI